MDYDARRWAGDHWNGWTHEQRAEFIEVCREESNLRSLRIHNGHQTSLRLFSEVERISGYS